ncbi:MAG: amidophosphoribosyltransferase [Bacteroidia bacterium]|nr:MAG: amidophosphoribosyltransferase [Bacteroidia bacterium]
MSESIKHECGIVLIRLKHTFSYYKEKYGTSRYGLHKLYQMMEKQINRGQDGAGIATVKLNILPGVNYIDRLRSVAPKAPQDIFQQIHQLFIEAARKYPLEYSNPEWQKQNIPFLGEVMMGHLRYGTYGKNTIHACHPFYRKNNWKARNLLLAGNFNLTNVDELFQHLVELGQHPSEKNDTVTAMEKIGHFLDRENERIFRIYKDKGLSNDEISIKIQEELDIASILYESTKKWDGGYAMVGIIGHGDAFVMRDPNGIRPAYYYEDDEIVVAASERPVIQSVFNVSYNDVMEIKPGHALIVKANGKVFEEKVLDPAGKFSCSFERIYFSRGNDADIYNERRKLGKNLALKVWDAIQGDIENAVFSYIPNTAEIAFGGLIDGIEEILNKQKVQKLAAAKNDEEKLKILLQRPRVHKIVWKDVKQRTFITDDENRDAVVDLGYDVTYGVVKPTDTLIVLDDSIVRGTTLKKNILRTLARLKPKKIIILSSAPQIRYPDCYGIDMSILGHFVAFQAAIALLKEKNQNKYIQEIYELAKQELQKHKEEQINVVKKIYEPFTAEEISDKIAQIVKPEDLNCELQIIYQSIEGLHDACPNHRGDWYFTGNYPTPGGNKVSNKSFVNYIENKNERAY